MANTSHARPTHGNLLTRGLSALSFRLDELVARHVRPALAALVETAPARNATLVAGAWLASIWIFAITLVALFVESAGRDAENAARNTAVMAAAYVRQTLNSGEIVLHSMHALLAENGATKETAFQGFVQGRKVHDTLRDRVRNLQEIDKAAFISPKGEVLNFSFQFPAPPINVADRDYFREQMTGAPPPLSLGLVVQDRGSGKWTFYLSQRILGAKGEAMGVAIVGLKADFLADFFARTTLTNDVAIVLQRNDGAVLTGSGIARDVYGKHFGTPYVPAVQAGTADPAVTLVTGPPGIPTLNGGTNYVEATAGIRGVPAHIVVLVDRMAFLSKAAWWSAALLAAALIGSVIVILSWRRSLRLISEGLRLSRISSMQAMTAAIAHELNQPLAATSNYLAVVAKRLDGTTPYDRVRQRDMIEKAQAQLLRAGEIIRRLRGFISEGKTDLQSVELAQVVDSAIDFSLVRDRHKDVEIDVHLESDTCSVHVDPIQVQQVLLNLIRNSAEAMAGRQDKRIEIESRLVGGRMVEVRVGDTGPGLPPHIARHAFEPFNSSKTDGMGVGLTICRTIIESHGGSIRYYMGPRGANFVFTLRTS